MMTRSVCNAGVNDDLHCFTCWRIALHCGRHVADGSGRPWAPREPSSEAKAQSPTTQNPSNQNAPSSVYSHQDNAAESTPPVNPVWGWGSMNSSLAVPQRPLLGVGGRARSLDVLPGALRERAQRGRIAVAVEHRAIARAHDHRRSG